MASAIIGVGRERKGTMFLRSNEMHYGRAVLNSNWHQARESEPRDFDLSRDPVRDLRRSTYHNLGTSNSSQQRFSRKRKAPAPRHSTTTLQQSRDCADYENYATLEAATSLMLLQSSLLNTSVCDDVTVTEHSEHADRASPEEELSESQLPAESTYSDHFKEKHVPVKQSATLEEGENESERDVRRSKHEFVVIPRHNSAQYPHHYTTTHKADYISEVKVGVRKTETVTVDHGAALKRCLSQFTDASNHRRSGRNTWQDESGVYTNGILKSACPYYSRTYTLMPGGVRPDGALN